MSVAGGDLSKGRRRSRLTTIECFACGGIGGIGDAGTVNVQAHSGPGNSMDFADVLYI